MSVKRAPRDGRFGTIDLTALEDPRLSESAKCVHAYAVTRPDGWRLNVEDLCRRMSCSEQKIAAAFKLLERHGYLRREKVREASGRFGFRYAFIERPTETSRHSTSVDSTSVEKPPVENGDWSPNKNIDQVPPTTETDNQKTDDQTTENNVVPTREIGPLSPPDEAIVEECLSILVGIPRYPFDAETDRWAIVRLRREFPRVNLIDVLNGWAMHKLDRPLSGDQTESPRRDIRNWVKRASKGIRSRSNFRPRISSDGFEVFG